MNKIPNRKAICDVLLREAAEDREILALCSDSRGSASMTPFADAFPAQFVEMGIAEQDLVGVAAGLASCEKKPYVFSPACFLTTRSYEQCKIDCAYSNTNVKLVGISGGVSYGALGMSHHSCQDIAAMCAIPNMRVYLPSDRHQTAALIRALLKDNAPAYIRVGRNAVEDVYPDGDPEFRMDHAQVLSDEGEALIVACGECVQQALKAAELLKKVGISVRILDMYCVKPLDKTALLRAAKGVKLVVTVEEHSPYGGLGAQVAQILAEELPVRVHCLALPDAPVAAETSAQVFRRYGIDGEGIARTVEELLK